MKSLILSVFIILSFLSCRTFNEPDEIIIGTGSKSGLYYPIGSSLSRLINNKNNSLSKKVTAISTEGSVNNIDKVLSGEYTFGIAQSDRQYQAYNGLKEWRNKGEQSNLRALFSLHSESITLLSRVDSKIESAKDLKGKFVNLGNYGSGQLENSRDVLKAYGLTEKEIQARFHKAEETPALIRDGHIDAYFYTVGHPNTNTRDATDGNTLILMVPIEGPEIDQFLEKHQYYAKSTIKKDFYPKLINSGDIKTIGVKATVVASSNTSKEIVYEFVKHIFENLEELKDLHPSLSELTKENMLEALSAPLHPGAEKYYKEVKIIP